LSSASNQSLTERSRAPRTDPLGAILLLDSDPARARGVVNQLRAVGRFSMVIPRGPAVHRQDHWNAFDLAVIELGGAQENGLAWVDEMSRPARCGEMVFFAVDGECAEVAVARSRGFDRIIPASSLGDWLSKAAPHLVRRSQARRMIVDIEAQIPPAPPFAQVAHISSMAPLGHAEQQFRRIYLRRVLAETRTRQEAARKAGVPYRTLCDMMRKLGLG
jgi:hypothetical protein